MGVNKLTLGWITSWVSRDCWGLEWKNSVCEMQGLFCPSKLIFLFSQKIN